MEIQGLSVFRERLVIPMPCVVDKRRECILEREKKKRREQFLFSGSFMVLADRGMVFYISSAIRL